MKNTEKLKQNNLIIGCLCALAAEILYGLSYVFTKNATELYSVYVEKASDFSGTEITYVMLICGAIVFILLTFVEGSLKGNFNNVLSLPFHDLGFLIAILYQGIGCSAIAFFLSNVAIARIGVNRTSSFIGIATVISTVAGAVILNEAFSIYQLIGAAIIIAGVYTANIKKKTGGLENEFIQ